MSSLASIAVVGGSGFYEFIDDAEQVKIDTPFGAPSDPITVGEVSGRRVAFLPRHGRDHRFPPHRSRTARICGRCVPSASGGCSPRPRSAR